MRNVALLLLTIASLVVTGWHLELVWESGVPDESGHWFGLVTDAAILADGRVVVLDQGSRQLALLDGAGAVTQVLGGEGRGPGEFLSPSSIELDGASRVLVLDPHVGRISVFEAGPDGLAYADSWIPPLSLDDFCLLGDRVIGLSVGGPGGAAGMVLHEMTWGGTSVARSFGPPADPSVERPNLAFGNGRLLCSAAEGLVVFLPDFYPEVHAFRADGAHAWTAALPGYEPVTIEAGTGSVRYTATAGYYDTGATLSAAGDRLVAQWARVSRGTPREETRTVTTALLSLPTGELREVRDDVPRLAFGGAGGFVGYSNAPYPKVARYREVER